MTTCLCFHRLCDSYDALPNCSNSKQTTPTTLHNPSSFGSLNSQPMMNGSNDNSIYKCSSDCCSMERQQRHNHSHFNHSGSNNNNKRKQKTKHHHRTNNKSSNQKLSPQEQLQQQQQQKYHRNAVTPDQNHANYEYIIGDESHCEDDENSCNLGKVTISENDETTEHDDGNSYSCDDTLTDDAILSGANRNRRAKHHNEESLKENQSENSRGSGSADGETCCSCSDDSCVYEEPPSHVIQVNQTHQLLEVGNEN